MGKAEGPPPTIGIEPRMGLGQRTRLPSIVMRPLSRSSFQPHRGVALELHAAGDRPLKQHRRGQGALARFKSLPMNDSADPEQLRLTIADADIIAAEDRITDIQGRMELLGAAGHDTSFVVCLLDDLQRELDRHRRYREMILSGLARLKGSIH